ncbi:acyl carrier protein [Streptomyces sp. NPDC059874]|uniref:acyl carrier protein n=1 Tax=Streptomyces sp. NPDC059874 TaxID=3346983 RepID=UPI00366787A7
MAVATVQEISQEVTEIVYETKKPEGGLDIHTKLSDLGVDGFDKVEIAAAIEERFGVEIPEKEFRNLDTVLEVSEYIAEHQS